MSKLPVRRHVQFEARVGALYLTRLGRVCKLLRVGPPSPNSSEPQLTFGYVDADNQVIRRGAGVDGFDMLESTASRLLTKVGGAA